MTETVTTPLGEQAKPGIGIVFCTPSQHFYDALVTIVDEVGDIEPAATRDTPDVLRTLYDTAPARNIINLPSPAMRRALGPHVACLTLVVSDPTAAGEDAVSIFAKYGISAELRLNADPELPRGFMAFVVTPEWPVPLLFWPAKVEPEVLRKLTPPKPWRRGA